MNGKGKKPKSTWDFCPECRKYVTIVPGQSKTIRTIHGKEYAFTLPEYICKECGRVLSPPGSIDETIEVYEEQLKKYGLL